MQDIPALLSGLDRWAAKDRVAEIAAEMYHEAENPGDRGTIAVLAEWFPKLREALDQAGMLKQ